MDCHEAEQRRSNHRWFDPRRADDGVDLRHDFRASVEDQRPECGRDDADLDAGTPETRFGARLRHCVNHSIELRHRHCRQTSARQYSSRSSTVFSSGISGTQPVSRRMRERSPRTSGVSFGRKRAGSCSIVIFTRAFATNKSTSDRIAVAVPEHTLYGTPGFAVAINARYARTVSRTSMMSRSASMLPIFSWAGLRPASISAICLAMLGATNAGDCLGPTWLNDRAISPGMRSSSHDRRVTISCASLLVPYGLLGLTGSDSAIARDCGS